MDFPHRVVQLDGRRSFERYVNENLNSIKP
jgi:hypothetical protein